MSNRFDEVDAAGKVPLSCGPLSGPGSRSRSLLAAALSILWALAAVWTVRAASPGRQVMPAATEPPFVTTVVQPGETLETIAARFGVPAESLLMANGLQNPRQLFPGQRLTVASSTSAEGSRYVLSSGESLRLLSRSRGVSLDGITRSNRLLIATGLPAGTAVWLPTASPFTGVVTRDAGGSSGAPRVAAAVVTGAHLWDVLWLNPMPPDHDQGVLVPKTDVPVGPHGGASMGTSELRAPLTWLAVSPQPVARGETVVVTVAADAPITCRLDASGQQEACVADQGAVRWVALLGLSPVMDPGNYTVNLAIAASDGTTFDVPISLSVSPGRYDYERIDLPPDRQSLLDPQLSQFERDIIARMRTVRSADRLWEYPFRRPVDAAVTSYFGSRRSYGYGFGSFHAGSDFDGVGGEPVLAPASGTVILAETLVVRGNAILVDHGWGVVSGFWHLSQIDVEVGQQVAQGQRIGLLGNTGLSTGAHLHWELWANGVSVNALSWLEPDGPAGVLGAVP